MSFRTSGLFITKRTSSFRYTTAALTEPSSSYSISVSTMIELKHIYLKYHKVLVQDGMMTLPSSSITAIIGQSGLGKTTLMNQIGFIDPNQNTIKTYSAIEGDKLRVSAYINIAGECKWSVKTKDGVELLTGDNKIQIMVNTANCL